MASGAALRQKNIYRHHCRKGEMVMFNNPGLRHRSQPYKKDSGRIMPPTTLKGTEAIEREKILS